MREMRVAVAATPSSAPKSRYCSKEADETQLWLELLIEDCQITQSLLPALHQELGELIAIFTTMVGKIKNR